MCSEAAARAQQELLLSIFIIACTPSQEQSAETVQNPKYLGLLPEVRAAVLGHPACPGQALSGTAGGLHGCARLGQAVWASEKRASTQHLEGCQSPILRCEWP